MASRNSSSVEPSAPRAEPPAASLNGANRVPNAARGRLARFALQLDAIIDGRDDSCTCALARAAAMPTAQTLGKTWAKLDDQAARDRRDLPAVRMLLPASALPPVV